MYLCHELSAAKLSQIADYFNLGHIGSVSFTTHKVRKQLKEDSSFKKKIDDLIKSIARQATWSSRPALHHVEK